MDGISGCDGDNKIIVEGVTENSKMFQISVEGAIIDFDYLYYY